MTSCTIIISHFHSLPFLRMCIRQIDKHRKEGIRQDIIVVDQSEYGYFEDMCIRLREELGNRHDIVFLNTQPLYSGFGIDYCMRNLWINTDYIVQLHVDAYPISDNWLSLAISLIEEYNLSFVGQLQFISDGTQSIYPPHPMFAMAQCFNVAKTETYRELSLQAGFTRFHNRPQSGLTFKNDDWSAWAEEDYNNRGSDDDIVAFSWNGKYKTDNMLGLAITGYIESGYGRLIEDLVFHFGSANEARGVMDKMPELYQYYTKKINENYSDELIDDMLQLANKNKPPELEILSRNFWDGKLKQSFPTNDEINKRIEELKKA